MTRRSALLLLAALLVLGCSDSTKDGSRSALLGFATSGCKRERAQELATEGVVARTGQDWVTKPYASETPGLKCIAWEASAPGKLTVDLFNFEEACGAKWEGSAHYDARTGLTLELTNPECWVAKCGWCIYDWSFDVAVPEQDGAAALAVSIDRCPGQNEVTRYTVALPMDRTSGILCRYANWYALEEQCGQLGNCGTEAMPCATSDGSAPCAAGLECASAPGSSGSVCLKTCGTDADCGTTGALSCQDGLCRPAQTW